MAKKTTHGVTSIDIASALDTLVSKVATDRNRLKGFAERAMGWSKEAAKVHDDQLIAQNKEALKDQREQIDRFVVSHIEEDDSCLKEGSLVAMDFAAIFWATSILKRMITSTEDFCIQYEHILKAMQGHRQGYGHTERLHELHALLRHRAAEAFHNAVMTDSALKAYTLMMPSAYSCLDRTRLLLSNTRKMMDLINQLRDAHQQVVSGSYRARHQSAAQTRFAA